MSDGARFLVVGIPEHRELGLRTFLRRSAELTIVDNFASDHLPLADVPVGVEDILDVEAVQVELRRVLRGQSFDGIVTLYDELLPTVSNVARHHGLVGLKPDAAAAALHKDLMRLRLRDSNVPMPSFSTCRTLEEAIHAVERIRLPVIVKPTNQAGSIGVTTVSQWSDLEVAFTAAWNWSLPSGSVLVESMLEGTEVSVESVVVGAQVLPVCVNHMDVVGSNRHEIGEAVPYSSGHDQSLHRITAEIHGALGIENAVTTTEFILTSGGPFLIEINARVAGALVPELVLLASGLNLYDVAFDLAIGQEPILTCHWNRAAAVRFLTSEPGRVSRVDGLHEALSSDGVVSVRCPVRPGEMLGDLEEGAPVRGAIVAVGDDYSCAESRARSAAGHVQFLLEPDVGV